MHPALPRSHGGMLISMLSTSWQWQTHRLLMWHTGHGHGCRPCETASLGPALPNPAVPVAMAPEASQGAPRVELGPGCRLPRGRLCEAPTTRRSRHTADAALRLPWRGTPTDGPNGHMLAGPRGVSAKPKESSCSKRGGGTGIPPIKPSAGAPPTLYASRQTEAVWERAGLEAICPRVPCSTLPAHTSGLVLLTWRTDEGASQLWPS